MHTNGLKDRSRLDKKELIFLILAATVTITFVSTSSPLYPFNPWDDVNVFFTMGRAIKHGMIPYKDIFDHKGPVLYFVFFLAAIVSEKSFVGIWILECILASVYAVFSWKIAKLFTSPSALSLVLVPLFLGILYTSRMFNFGGNTEELCFPLLTVALYLGLRSVVESNGLPANTDALICGLISGVLFWIKYTFLGFIIGFCIYIVCLAIKQKCFARLWSLIWRFIVGVLVISIPVLSYFAITGTLEYLWESYFYVNIFLYNDADVVLFANVPPILEKIFIMVFCLGETMIRFKGFGTMLLMTFVSLGFVDKKYRKKTVFLFAVTFVFATAFIFTRNRYVFYYGYLLSYCFGIMLIPFIRGLNTAEAVFKDHPAIIRALTSITLLVFYAVSIILCKNMYLIFQSKTAVAQYRIADTINQTPDAKMLTYDIMDVGFYTAAGLLPCNRYCASKQFGDSYPQLQEEQDKLIAEGYFDYIVTSYFVEEDWDNYELIQEEAVPYIDFTGDKILDGFKLYKKI